MNDTARIHDEAAITAVLENLDKAWAAGDADAFVADFTDDSTAIMPGSYQDTKEGSRQDMTERLTTVLKGSTATDKIRSIRFLGQDVAVVISETAILFPGETELPADRLIYATWVMEKRDGSWFLAAYHNSPAHTA